MDLKEKLYANWAIIVLILAFALIGFILLQQNSFINEDFDTYMYSEVVRVLVTQGSILSNPHLAFPNILNNGVNNRFGAIIPYWQGGLYLLANKLFNAQLWQVESLYPPIMYLLMTGFIFILLLKHYKNEVIALGTSLIVLSLPVFNQQFAGAMFQEAPFGFFSVIALIATYYLAITTNKNRYIFLAGIAYLAVLLGSKYFTVASAIIPVFIFLEVLILYLKNLDLKPFLKTNLYILPFPILANIGLYLYQAGFTVAGFTVHGIFLPINLILIVLPLLFGVLLYSINNALINGQLKPIQSNYQKHNKAIPFVIVCAILLILSLPILDKLITYALYLATFGHQSIALFNTVQEFIGLNTDLTGYIGYPLGLVIIYYPIMIVFLSILAYKLYKRENPIFLLLLLPMISLAYAGLAQGKYVADFALMLIIWLGAICGEVVTLQKRKEIK